MVQMLTIALAYHAKMGVCVSMLSGHSNASVSLALQIFCAPRISMSVNRSRVKMVERAKTMWQALRARAQQVGSPLTARSTFAKPMHNLVCMVGSALSQITRAI